MALNCVTAVANYIQKLTEVSGMKALLMDKDTTGIVGMVSSLTEILAQEVFLVERIDEDNQQGDSKAPEANMHHLKAVVFIRPSERSLNALKEQLKRPKYKEYHIFFSNILREEWLSQLAEADEFEVIKQVQEYYADYYAVNDDMFTLNQFHSKALGMRETEWHENERATFRRNIEGLGAMLLSCKKRPAVRYARSSELAKRAAYEITRRMKEEAELFHFQQGHSTPLLIILDRRDDPVTPLLTQWTYQAMVHELIEIKNNRVDMSAVPNVRKENRQIVLSPLQDNFYRSAMYLNFGDLGASIKNLVEDYRKKAGSNKEISTLEDMKRFIDQYPEFRSMASNTSKHVAIVSELSRLVDLRNLMSVSEIEQELACQNDHAAALEKVLKLLEDPKPSDADKLRVAILYALRYETQRNQIATVKSILRDKASTDTAKNRVRAIDTILNYCGAQVRSSDLFGGKTFASKISQLFTTGLKGVDNIYTQHRSVLNNTLDTLAKGKMKVAEFPYVDGQEEKHEDIFIYIMGGCTMEEAVDVATFNKANNNMRVILGGSCVHNSRTFIDDVLGVEQHHYGDAPL